MAGSQGEERREQVLKMLWDHSEDREGSPKQQPSNPAYRLVEGSNIGYAYDRTSSFDRRSVREFNRHCTRLIVNSGGNPNFGSRVSIGKWMRSIREEDQPIASFYFPDNYCGPDIVFCLAPEKPRISDLVLCVLQVSLPLAAEANGLLMFVLFKKAENRAS